MGHSVYTQYTPWYTQVWSLPNGLADSRKPRLFAYRAVHLMVCYEWYMHRPHYVSYQLYPLQYFKQSRRSTTATSNRARLFTRIHTVLSHNSLNVKVLSIVVLKMLSYTYSCWKKHRKQQNFFCLHQCLNCRGLRRRKNGFSETQNIFWVDFRNSAILILTLNSSCNCFFSDGSVNNSAIAEHYFLLFIVSFCLRRECMIVFSQHRRNSHHERT